MKTRVALIFSLLFLLQSYTYGQKGHDSKLYFIQDSIYSEFLKSFEQKNAKGLDRIENDLVNKNSLQHNYWLAYAKYYKSIYYLKMGNKKQSKKIIQEAISIWKDTRSLRSEELALLALMQSFSIQFTPGMGAGVLSARVKENAFKSVEIDSNNVRGWYVLASNDYYTPKQFGGGKKAEGYLLKAISLPEPPAKNPLLPSWGKSDSYNLLISLYIDRKDMVKAEKMFIQAKKLYPDNYMINQYAEKFRN